MNGDGKPDIVTVNQTGGTVSVLLGAGDGTYGLNTDYPTGGNPKAVALVDVNGDGKLDIVTANSSDNTVSVLIGNGNGTFKARVDYTTGSAPSFLTLADTNGDGKLDIVTVNASAGTISILAGNGNGTFNAKTDYAVGYSPTSVAVMDVNKDAIPDLVVLTSYSSAVSVFIGNGDGTFKSKLNYPTGSAPVGMVVADVNKDGIPDIMTANSGSSTVSVLIGKGDGTFKAKVDYAVGGVPATIALADINSDGNPDVITANSSNYSVSVLTGKGDGTFNPDSDYLTDYVPQSVAVADVNGDGKPDLVTANPGTNSVTVLLNVFAAQPLHTLIYENSVTNDVVAWQLSGTTDTGSRTLYAQGIGLEWKIVGFADVTGNGYPALIWQRSTNGDVVYWQTDGTKPTAVRGFLSYGAQVGPEWKIVAVGDITGDGKPDLIWQNSINGNVVYWQMSGTQFVTSGLLAYGSQVGTEWKIVAVADVTGDGQNDLIWQNSINGNVVYWQMNGTQFVTSGFLAFGAQVGTEWKIVATTDVTGDGKPDLIWQNKNNGYVVYWQMNGTQHVGTGFITQGVPSVYRVVGLK